MMRFLVLTVAAFLAGGLLAPAPARPQEALPPAGVGEAGQALAERLRSSRPTEDSEYQGLLKIRAREADPRAVPLRCRIIVGESNWKALYETAPTNQLAPEKLVIVHWPDRPNEYWYARGSRTGSAPSEPVLLTSAQTAVPFAGSDFWLVDLGLDFLHWPSQRVLRTEMRKGRVCHVLESSHPLVTPSLYARVVSWLDKETGGPVLAEGYDGENKLIKEFSIRSFKNVDGRWQLQEMEIRSPRTGSRTRLEFKFKPE